MWDGVRVEVGWNGVMPFYTPVKIFSMILGQSVLGMVEETGVSTDPSDRQMY